MKKSVLQIFVAVIFAAEMALQLHAQGTAFTYQGQLSNGSIPVSGSFDLAFTLYNTNSNGVVLAGPVTNTATLVSNGLFTTTIDFGAGVFTGNSNWLAIAVRTNGLGSFTPLAPRQQVLPTPYAIYSTTAGSATSASTAGTATSANSAITAITATTATNLIGNVSDAQLSSNVVRLNGINQFSGTNTFANVIATNGNNAFGGTFVGNGAGLTNLNATQLTGPITLSQLPGAVLTNNSTGVTLSGTFIGNGSGLSGLTATATNLPTGFLTNNANGAIFNGLTTVSNLSITGTSFISNLVVSNPPALNGSSITNLNASQISRGTWNNASLNYSYQTLSTNYTTTTNDVVLVCTGTNQIVTLLSATNFPPTSMITIWSDNPNGSVIVTNATGSEPITVPGLGQGLVVYLGPANSPSNSVTLMVHGGHW